MMPRAHSKRTWDPSGSWSITALVVKAFRAVEDGTFGVAYEMDQSIAMVMESLHKRGMLENSIVLFSTDNKGRCEGRGVYMEPTAVESRSPPRPKGTHQGLVANSLHCGR